MLERTNSKKIQSSFRSRMMQCNLIKFVPGWTGNERMILNANFPYHSIFLSTMGSFVEFANIYILILTVMLP